MNNFGALISQLRRERKLSQEDFGQMIGCTKQSISNYERNTRKPDYETLEAIADAFNVPMSFFLSEEEQREKLDRIYRTYDIVRKGDFAADVDNSPVSTSVLRIPILGTIPAGIPLEAVEDIVGWEELPAGMARGGKEYFGLKVTGDSMYPRYEDGDVLILRKQDTCESGQDCAVMVGNSDATFKRVRLGPSGVTLHPLNPSFETYHYTNQEVVDLPVRILGVVVELRRKI